MRRPLVVAALVAAFASAASGCGSATRSVSGSFHPNATTAYVRAQARALCLVQSKAFPTQAALHAAYVRAEHSANLPASELARVRATASHDAALRTRISDRVAASCGKSP